MKNKVYYHDVIGKKFGELKVVSYAGKINGQSYLNCICRHDNFLKVNLGNLNSGHSKSCRCESYRYKRGISNTPEYKAWKSIIKRCKNKNHHAYEKYGGRGITICKEWENDFNKFYDYIGKRPSAKYSIDRINNNKGYHPGNIRWATKSIQSFNRGKQKNNTSGITGVYAYYLWDIMRDGKRLHGRANSLEDAIKERKKAEKILYPEINLTR